MSKTLRVDFFRVSGPIAFETALRRIWDLPTDDARNHLFRDDPVRLRALSTHDGFIFGDMIRIRVGEPAIIAKVQGGEKPVELEADEGLGETSAFMYQPQTRYIGYQRNRSGVSASRAAYYVQQKSDQRDPFVFEPMLSPARIEDLMGKGPPKKVTMKVVATGLDRDSVTSHALSEVIDAANNMESTEVSITFSIGRARRAGLRRNGVLEMVRSGLSLMRDGHHVKSLEVFAPPDENGGRSEVLDFIDATLQSSVQVEPSKLMDEFFRRRIACLRDAWESHARTLV